MNQSHRRLIRRDFLRTGLAVAAGWTLAAIGIRRGLTGSSEPRPWPAARPGQPLWAAPACVVRPEQTEGPFFVDERLNRSDIRSDPSDGSVKQGVPLRLVFNVSRVEGPYASKGRRALRNEQDGIFRANGEMLKLPLAREGTGYAGTFNIGLRIS